MAASNSMSPDPNNVDNIACSVGRLAMLRLAELETRENSRETLELERYRNLRQQERDIISLANALADTKQIALAIRGVAELMVPKLEVLGKELSGELDRRREQELGFAAELEALKAQLTSMGVAFAAEQRNDEDEDGRPSLNLVLSELQHIRAELDEDTPPPPSKPTKYPSGIPGAIAIIASKGHPGSALAGALIATIALATVLTVVPGLLMYLVKAGVELFAK